MPSLSGLQLLCLENPLLDISGQGDEAMLEKYGLKPNDAILAEEKHMGIYEDLLNNRDAKLLAGGAAQNTARGAQYMLPADSVLYIGCVGNDDTATTLRDACAKAGLRVEYRVDETQPTGRCGVVITGHNRSLCTHLAAANEYKLEHLKQPSIWKQVEEAKVYYVGGFHLTVCVPAVMALAEEAVKENKVMMLNISAPFIAEFFIDPLEKTMEYVDYLIGNETEARAWAKTKKAVGGSEKIADIALWLANLPGKKNEKRERVVVITQGVDPTVVAVQGEKGVKEFPVRKVEEKEICDTTGAGDAFAAGFVSGIVEGKTLEQCVDMGQWLASLSIMELGPQYPFPKQTYHPSP